MICIFGCGTKKGENRGCNGHTDPTTVTVDCDASVEPTVEADLTKYPVQGVGGYSQKMEKVVFENLPLDVATELNVWKNAFALLKDGGILEVNTGSYDYKTFIPILETLALQVGIKKDNKYSGAYEVTNIRLSITWTYFRT